MATSESDDFESADEDFEPKNEKSFSDQGKSDVKTNQESDPTSEQGSKAEEGITDSSVTTQTSKTADKQGDTEVSKVTTENYESKIKDKKSPTSPVQKDESPGVPEESPPVIEDTNKELTGEKDNTESASPEISSSVSPEDTENKTSTNRRSGGRKRDQQKPRESKIGATKLGTKKLGARVPAPVTKFECEEMETDSKDSREESTDSCIIPSSIPKLDENPVPEPASINETSNKPSEEFASVFDRLSLAADKSPLEEKDKDTSQPTQSSGWGSWGGWGSSILSSATASVSTLTSHVSQGINTVIETVEGGLGAPDPEELARQDLEAEKLIAAVKEPIPQEETSATEPVYSGAEGGGLFPLGQIFSGVSHLGKIVETTSAKVLSGGLDTLEVIGKKTMEVLQDGDPGLKKKRALFQPDRPILSQVLREAKDHAEEDAKLIEEKQAARKVHFETLFDDFQGLIHLEALEMLSRQCEMKLHASLLGLAGADLQATQSCLHEVRDECLLPDPDDMPDEPQNDIEATLSAAFAALPVDVTADKLLKVWEEVQKSADSSSETLPESDEETAAALGLMHQNAISSLAQLTACCVEQFHRTGELLLVHEPREPQKEAAQLMQITLLESSMIEQLASNLCENINKFGEPAQPIITKVFLEASNSSTYIQDAFQLLVPVLQVGAV